MYVFYCLLFGSKNTDTTHVGSEALGNGHAAVCLKMIFKEGYEHAGRSNNTVVAPPRMLIAFLENNLNADGSVNIPEALRPYMGGTEKLIPKK